MFCVLVGWCVFGCGVFVFMFDYGFVVLFVVPGGFVCTGGFDLRCFLVYVGWLYLFGGLVWVDFVCCGLCICCCVVGEFLLVLVVGWCLACVCLLVFVLLGGCWWL